MCIVVIACIVNNPTNWFLNIWMIFGIAGLLAVPHAFIQYFVVTIFDEDIENYYIIESGPLGKRQLTINKTEFNGFEFDKDEDDKETESLFVTYAIGTKCIRKSILYWMKKEYKQDVINKLKWGQG